MNNIHTEALWFSPTKSTNVICKTIADKISPEVVYHDLTLPKDVKEINIVADIAIFGAPVYGGRIPTAAIERFKKVHSNKTPAVVVVVYGNRDYDDALLELKILVEEQGFNVIAAAAFIGEHSFSNKDHPIAEKRPDKTDLTMAMDFAEKIGQKLTNEALKKVVEIPGNIPFRERSAINAAPPATIAEKCTLCGLCARICPVKAITVTDMVETDQELCIYCCACVKVCTEDARTAETDLFVNARTKLHSFCSDRKEPQIFI